jgi:SAM-dependent methyltransferase
MSKEVIYQQLGLPVFQNKVYTMPELAKLAAIGDVKLVQCATTGLVYNGTFQPSLLQYDEDYQNEQACSPAFRSHLENVLSILLSNTEANDFGVEIGCGKGYFLEMLLSAGANVVGFDPSYDGTNPRVVKKYYAAKEVDANPDYVILRHVLEHIPDPWPFLSQLVSKCQPGTKIYIEVPSFEWIVENNAFYDVFYEHVNYFTLDVLRRAFSNVIESGKLFGGQYLYLVAELASFRTPDCYAGPQFSPLGIDRYLDSLLGTKVGSSEELYIWGAGAKGITFSNIAIRRGVQISGLVDINPAKQGKFAGLSGIPIHAPHDVLPLLVGKDVFVMNPVYLAEIKLMAGTAKINWISVTQQ